jgi:hypothetical protein
MLNVRLLSLLAAMNEITSSILVQVIINEFLINCKKSLHIKSVLTYKNLSRIALSLNIYTPKNKYHLLCVFIMFFLIVLLLIMSFITLLIIDIVILF